MKMGISRKIREQLLILHNRGQINLGINKPGTSHNEFFYAHLPLAVIDSVFARGQGIKATSKVVNNYCSYYSLKKNRDIDEYPPAEEQESIKQFMKKFEYEGEWEFRNNIFCSSETTSFRIDCKSKAMAVYDFSELLNLYGINYFQDVSKVCHDESFASEAVRAAGITEEGLNYFFLLSGCGTMTGIARTMTDFVSGTAGKDVPHSFTAEVIDDVCDTLRPQFPAINVRALSYIVWDYVRKGDYLSLN